MLVEIFSSEHCPNCGPTIKMLESLGHEVTITKVDTDGGQYRARAFGVMCLPTVVANGKVCYRGKPGSVKTLEDAIKQTL